MGHNAVVKADAGETPTQFTHLKAGVRLVGHVEAVAVAQGGEENVIAYAKVDRLGKERVNTHHRRALLQRAQAKVLEPDLGAFDSVHQALFIFYRDDGALGASGPGVSSLGNAKCQGAVITEDSERAGAIDIIAVQINIKIVAAVEYQIGVDYVWIGVDSACIITLFPAGDGCNTCSCLAGGQVACTEMYCCSPETEWYRNYVIHDEEKCWAAYIVCPENTTYFINPCGCGCEQSPDCPQYINCMPPIDYDCEEMKKQCPYSPVAW